MRETGKESGREPDHKKIRSRSERWPRQTRAASAVSGRFPVESLCISLYGACGERESVCQRERWRERERERCLCIRLD